MTARGKLAAVLGAVAVVLFAAAPEAQAQITITPASPVTVYQGAPQAFDARPTSGQCGGLTDGSWIWQVSGGGTISVNFPTTVNGSSAVFWAGNTPGTYTLTVACMLRQPSSIQIVIPPVSVTVDPIPPLPQGEHRWLSAQVTHWDQGVTWSINPAAGTLQYPGGVAEFVAGTTAGTWTLTAMSVADPSKSGATPLTVLPAPDVTLSPSTTTLTPGAQQIFFASVTNTSNPAVTWSGSGGTITSLSTTSARFTAGSLGGSYTLFATSVSHPSRSGSAAIKIVAVSVSPSGVTVPRGTSRQFFANVTQSTQAVTWSTNAPGATITSGGLFTAGAATPDGNYTVTATTVGSPVASGSASLTVAASVPVVAVRVAPATAQVRGGAPLQLSARVEAAAGELHPNQSVTWTVTGPAAASVSAAGVFTAPDVAGTYVITARSVADTTKTGTASIGVPREVVLAPDWTSLGPGATQLFEARAFGFGNPAVTWSVREGAPGGTVSSAGLYTAPAASGVYHVVASATAQPTTQAVATVTVTPAAPIAVSVAPDAVLVDRGGTQQFLAVVAGTTNQAVTWSASAGSITAAGLFTAPSSYGTVIVTATSVQNGSARGSAAVVVSDGMTDQEFTYDANGNLISDGVRTFEWDVENRLIAVVSGGLRSEFRYDGMGRRFLIEEKNGGVTTSRRRYVWIGTRLVEERDSPVGAFQLPKSFAPTPTTDAEMLRAHDQMDAVPEPEAKEGEAGGEALDSQTP